MTWFCISLKRIFWVLTLVANISVITSSFASSQTASEQTWIVGFLYNFLKFTEWPDGSIKNEINLCTDKSSAFEELKTISARNVQNKPIQIKYITLSDSPEECQSLFLSRETSVESIREWIKLTQNQPILIVSNINGFLDMDGMIVLINDGKNLNFAINLEITRNSGIKLNAQLLQIAREVRGR